MTEPKPGPEPGPPVLGTWKRLYALVLGMLLLDILLFYAFGRIFS
jgi:hypothetical protein